MENFKYDINDFYNNNKEVWSYIEDLSCEEICDLVGSFKDKDINSGLISLIKEKVKSLSLEEIESSLEKIKTETFANVSKEKDKIYSILEKRKFKVIKRQKENAVFPIFKEFYNNLSKEHKDVLMDILYRDETRYRKLRNQL